MSIVGTTISLAGHVSLIEEWMKRVPKPGPGWDEDPDPPRMNE